MIKNYEEFTVEFFRFKKSKEVLDTGIKQSKLDKHKGEIAEYLREHGKKFTFAILKMLFQEAIKEKKKREIKKGGYKMIHRALPVVAAVFFPIFALVGAILGNTRTMNKIIKPILDDPGNNYPEFLKKLIEVTMIVAEGDIRPILGEDKFYDAFVITDESIKMIRKDVLRDFSVYLGERIEGEDQESEVPKAYIENELKQYLNDRFKITPPMQFEEGHLPTK